MGQFCREDMNNFMAERLWFIHASLSKGLSSRANKPNFGRHGVWRNLKKPLLIALFCFTHSLKALHLDADTDNLL